MSSKLETFKRNLTTFKAQREITPERYTPRDQYAYLNPLLGLDVQQINQERSASDIPSYISDHWILFLQTYVPANILGCTSWPPEVQRVRFEHAMLDEYDRMFRDRIAISNRDTYWKPSVEHITDKCGFTVKLANVTIATIS